MNEVRLIVGPADHGWEVRGDSDRVDAFVTLEEAERAARALARELRARGRPASIWRRELGGRLVEAPDLSDAP